MQESSSFRKCSRKNKKNSSLGEQIDKGQAEVQWLEEERKQTVGSNLRHVGFQGHVELIWALTFLKRGREKNKINKYVEGNETHNYKREFGVHLEAFPRSCISIVWVVFEFCVKLKIRFYNFMSWRDIKIFDIVLSTWHSQEIMSIWNESKKNNVKFKARMYS